MATINYAVREISVKIVYYGGGLCGKTTNLQVIHRKIPNEHRSDMVSLATETDRTLFFDFLPLDLGKIKGFATKFQLYTVPGQVYYNATRKLVLRGVDGVVFVVDSAADKLQENLESFRNLEENLAEYGYQRDSIPIILQYNKRDLPNAMPIEKLNAAMNKSGLLWNESVAVQGKGIFESLKIIGKLVIDNLNKKYSRPSSAQSAPSVAPPSPVQSDVFNVAPAVPRPQQTQQRQVYSPAPQNPAPARPQQKQQQNFAPPSRPQAQAVRPPVEQPTVVSSSSPFDDPFQDSATVQGNPRASSLEQDFEIQQAPIIVQPTKRQAPPIQNDSYDYGSINLEPMEQPSVAHDIEIEPMQQGQQYQESSSMEKTDLDLEIERYQREIDEKQRRIHPPSSMPPKSASPAPRASSYDVYEPIEPAEKQNLQSYQSQQTSEDETDAGGDQPLYFTSVNTDRQKKPKKPPINPKNRPPETFFSKLFNKEKP